MDVWEGGELQLGSGYGGHETMQGKNKRTVGLMDLDAFLNAHADQVKLHSFSIPVAGSLSFISSLVNDLEYTYGRPQ